jgi:hypothetical protein
MFKVIEPVFQIPHCCHHPQIVFVFPEGVSHDHVKVAPRNGSGIQKSRKFSKVWAKKTINGEREAKDQSFTDCCPGKRRNGPTPA